MLGEDIYSRSRSNDTRCDAASNVPLNLRKCCTVRFQPLEEISFILARNTRRAISRAFAVVVAHFTSFLTKFKFRWFRFQGTVFRFSFRFHHIVSSCSRNLKHNTIPSPSLVVQRRKNYTHINYSIYINLKYKLNLYPFFSILVVKHQHTHTHYANANPSVPSNNTNSMRFNICSLLS